MRLVTARHLREAVHLDILRRWAHLARVEPQNVDRTITSHQLLDLSVGKADEFLPHSGLLNSVVVRVASARRRGRIPVVGRVPIGFGEISSNPKILTSKS